VSVRPARSSLTFTACRPETTAAVPLRHLIPSSTAHLAGRSVPREPPPAHAVRRCRRFRWCAWARSRPAWVPARAAFPLPAAGTGAEGW